jgi:hypothetical protein
MLSPSKKARTDFALFPPEAGTNVTVATVSKGLATEPSPFSATSWTPYLVAESVPVVKMAARAAGPLASRPAKSRPPNC